MDTITEGHIVGSVTLEAHSSIQENQQFIESVDISGVDTFTPVCEIEFMVEVITGVITETPPPSPKTERQEPQLICRGKDG
ncbi:MAG: hypothetical protein FWG12_06880 [Holophagaceae bacterium]|jgi:hypothetical protein|nr:hypothetical protein [Holophagaceae bacterium]